MPDHPVRSDHPVRFILDDGETLTVAAADLEQVYELLWKLAPRPGAVSVAALIRGATRADILRAELDLDVPQSAALRDAVALLHPNAFDLQGMSSPTSVLVCDQRPHPTIRSR